MLRDAIDVDVQDGVNSDVRIPGIGDAQGFYDKHNAIHGCRSSGHVIGYVVLDN